jgi:hypothetical protein
LCCKKKLVGFKLGSCFHSERKKKKKKKKKKKSLVLEFLRFLDVDRKLFCLCIDSWIWDLLLLLNPLQFFCDVFFSKDDDGCRMLHHVEMLAIFCGGSVFFGSHGGFASGMAGEEMGAKAAAGAGAEKLQFFS